MNLLDRYFGTNVTDFQEEDRAVDVQTANQNYLLPRNENVNNQQSSPVKRIIYNDNNLVSNFCLKYRQCIHYIFFLFTGRPSDGACQEQSNFIEQRHSVTC